MPSEIAQKIQSAREQFVYIPRALRLLWTAARAWMVVWLVLLIIQGLLPAASVYLTKLLVDSLEAAIDGGLAWGNVRPVLIPAALMAGILVLQQLLGSAIGWIRMAQSELVQDHVKAIVHEKAAAMDLAFYETSAYYDHMARANGQAAQRSLSLLESMGGLLKNAVTLIGIAALLIPYAWWLPLALLVSTLPALWVVLRHNSLRHAWWEETTKDRRWTQYFDRVLTFRSMAPEVRIFGLSDYYRNAYNRLRHELRDSRLRLLRNQNLASVAANGSALLVTGAVMVWMVWRAFLGAATLGDLALFYRAFNQGQGLMRALLSSVGTLYTNTLFLEHLFTFLDLESNIEDPPDPVPAPDTLRRGIRFRAVDFRYPGSERKALQNFNLTIPAGKTVAIVGPNGAGKSTLIKLLCRFYDPEAGDVELDGIDLREMSVEELRRRITVLFQTPVRYAATAGENIAMGDIDADMDPARIARAADGGGARAIIEELPQGYDTLLSKRFAEGAELSGGQWQRVTLARAFYREAPIVVLDEPTSFMDSWAEMKWLDRFRKLVEDRTAVIVTHRFTTAMRADVIHVMDGGCIIESGTHEELLEQGGRYATSWKAQTQAGRHTAPSTNGYAEARASAQPLS